MNMIKSLVAFAATFILCSCSTQSIVDMNKQYKSYFQENTKYQIVNVVDRSGYKPKLADDPAINLVKSMRTALTNALKDNGLLGKNDLSISTTITEYAPGDAFKRWLLPGTGETRLVTLTTITNKDGKKLGTILTTRKVSFGGGFTIGEWSRVFDSVADEICTKLKEMAM